MMDECGAVSGVSGKGMEVLGEKPAPVQLYPPQVSCDLTWVRTRAAMVGILRLTYGGAKCILTINLQSLNYVKWFYFHTNITAHITRPLEALMQMIKKTIISEV
jgi:hypothetical protein